MNTLHLFIYENKLTLHAKIIKIYKGIRMPIHKITEQDSKYVNLEKMDIGEIVRHINDEDLTVAQAVKEVLPQIVKLIDAIEQRMKQGGRLFYIGAGTSGRLGVLDASELPPTFGVEKDRVIALIAGGDAALRNAVEKAEDVLEQGWIDLMKFHPDTKDCVIGIAASGTTPYVVETLKRANESGLLTGCITCNPDAPIAAHACYPVTVVVGPEFITGSTRMKSGTAQKMILNMISSTLMIRQGRVKGNKMSHMQLTNNKLIDRGIRIIQEELHIGYEEARKKLLDAGSVDKVIGINKKRNSHPY